MRKNKNESGKDLFPIAVLVFTGIYTGLTILIGWLLIDWRRWSGIIYFVGFELLFVGIAYDITESLFALFAGPYYIPKLSRLNEYPSVAVLMTVCDDARSDRWMALEQAYPNYDAYILDDSRISAQREMVDRSGYEVVRRANREGYKAGNLNNWLRRFAAKYKYFIILDSDSLIEPDFVGALVAYAEHPNNQSVAIFQSFIMPMGAETKFSQTLGNMARMRKYILERFAGRTGLVLSWGHNQLLRTDAILAVGGFNESVSPEDTTMSLMLSSAGYSCQLVNVESYDSDPPDIFSFSRRITRWAGQTAELFSLPWSGAAFRLKALLCFHLYSYTVYVFYLSLLVITAWAYDSSELSLIQLWTFVTGKPDQIWIWVLVLTGMTLLWIAQLGLRILISRRANITMREFVSHTLLSTALYSFTGLAVLISVLRVFAGGRMKFLPTNAGSVYQPVEWKLIVWDLLFWFVGGALIVTGMMIRNRLLFFSLNGLWMVFWFLAPYTLWLFHKDQKFTRMMR